MPDSLKLVTLNIEGNKHLNRFLPWLKEQQADVVCLQEVFSQDMPEISQEIGLKGHFVPMSRVEKENKYDITPRGLWGIGFFTNLKHKPIESFWYKGEKENIPEFTEPNSSNRVLLVGVVKKGRTEFTIGTTHFTWSSGGRASDEQWRDLERMLQFARQYEELVLCGDFNAPRGGEIFSALSETFTDHLPEKYTTTIDPNFHYAGPLELVVDTIFSTDGYKVTHVHAEDGLSDHQAVVGHVKKA